jgi:hypothetical protein
MGVPFETKKLFQEKRLVENKELVVGHRKLFLKNRKEKEINKVNSSIESTASQMEFREQSLLSSLDLDFLK